MKLVFLSHDGNCNGGAQKCLVDLLKGIRLKYPDLKIYIIFPFEGDLLNLCSPYIDGYKVISMRWWLLDNNGVVPFWRRLSFILKSLKKVVKIGRYLKLIKPDCAITNTIVLPYLALSCRLLSIKHIWFIHEIPATWNDRRFVFTTRTVYKWIDYLSRNIIVPSNYAKSYYAREISVDKIEVVDQAVDMGPIISSPREKHERYTVLLVGAFDSNKGQIELLKAVKRIVNSGKDINCYMVGSDAGTLSDCKDYIALNKLESNVVIVPFTEQITKYYLLADVLVVCSGFETFGRVAVEAQKCGLPVILSNVGANPERIEDGINGLLYKKGDINDLVTKIEMLRDECIRGVFIENVKKINWKRYNIVGFASQFYDFIRL